MYLKRTGMLLSIVLILTFAGCSFFATPADTINPAVVFGSNMVLQQNKKIPVWGKATPGGKVTILFDGQKKAAVASRDSLWLVDFAETTAGGPFEMTFIGTDTITYKNVMVGEVWVCSGQSNMEMPVSGWGKVLNYEQEIKDANYPNVRLFHVEHTKSFSPQFNVSTNGWETCTPMTIPNFSSTAYFFGRHLYKQLNIPIGLIHTSWGGTVSEAWTSGESLKKLDDFKLQVESIEQNNSTEQELVMQYNEILANWWKEIEDAVDQYQAQFNENWQDFTLNTSQWKKMDIPSTWEEAGLQPFDGAVWFRKTVTIPASWAGKELLLNLDFINDQDVTWFNGTKGGSEKDFPIARKYKIPASIVKAGRNVIAVRVIDIAGTGGLCGSASKLSLDLNDNNKIPLKGEWLYRPGLEFSKLPRFPKSPLDQNCPTVLYNAMIHPLIPYAIRGAIWYQGEANAGRAYQYRTLFPTLIQDWRESWAQGDFPFLFVQLANFMKINSLPEEAAWAELREAQLMTLSQPNTGMAVAIDIGDAKDIHPKNKQEVGRRLALNALGIAYEKDIVYSGPIYKSMTIEGDKIRLIFEHTGDGLVVKGGGELKGFAIAGADKKFHWAKARIEGKNIVVSGSDVSAPVAVRYAWASNPVCNLCNKAGLPASPFRTDSWPGLKVNSK